MTSATVNNPGATTHVGDLDSSTTAKGNTWTALITITVHDANHAPLAGATVSGSWSLGSAGLIVHDRQQRAVHGQQIGDVEARGVGDVHCERRHGSIKDGYASSLNHDPDGDSNGTSVTVSR